MNKVIVRKEDMNRLVMNYLVTEGYADAARQFSIESGAAILDSGDRDSPSDSSAAKQTSQSAMDVDQAEGGEGGAAKNEASVSAVSNIDERMEVRSSVQRGNIEAAIDKVNDINPNILDESDHVYFRLQQQRLIELIRKGEVEEALQFAHDYLAPRGEDNVRHATFCSRFARACFPATMYRSRVADRVVWRCIVLFHLSTRTNRRLQTVLLDELERTITLLAFQMPLESPLSSLMEDSHRHKTASEVNAAILSSATCESEAKLSVLIKMLVWAQKQLKEKHNCVFPVIHNLLEGTMLAAPGVLGDCEGTDNERSDYHVTDVGVREETMRLLALPPPAV